MAYARPVVQSCRQLNGLQTAFEPAIFPGISRLRHDSTPEDPGTRVANATDSLSVAPPVEKRLLGRVLSFFSVAEDATERAHQLDANLVNDANPFRLPWLRAVAAFFRRRRRTCSERPASRGPPVPGRVAVMRAAIAGVCQRGLSPERPPPPLGQHCAAAGLGVPVSDRAGAEQFCKNCAHFVRPFAFDSKGVDELSLPALTS